jgi:hypothetical protein
MIHKLVKEVWLMITAWSSRLYKGCHIWRKVKKRNISQLQFKLMSVQCSYQVTV